jgi:hypothetical protein
MQGQTRPTWYVRFPHQSTCIRHTLPAGGPRMWQPFTSHWQSWTEPLLPRKRVPDIIHSIPANRSVGLYPVFLSSQPLKQWRKSSICRQQATSLTRLISPSCDRYVQYSRVPTWKFIDVDKRGCVEVVLRHFHRSRYRSGPLWFFCGEGL